MKIIKLIVTFISITVIVIAVLSVLFAMWGSMQGTYQVVMSVCSLTTAMLALFTADLNRKSSERMEKQAKQAEEDKHSAVKPLFFADSISYSVDGFTLTIKQKGDKIYHMEKTEWKGTEGVEATIETFIDRKSENIYHKITICSEKDKFPIHGEIKIFYKNLYGKIDVQSIGNIIYKGTNDRLENLSNKVFQ